MDSFLSGIIICDKNIYLDIWKLSLGNASNEDTFIQRNLLNLTKDSGNLWHFSNSAAQHNGSSTHHRWHPKKWGSVSPVLPVKEYSICPEQGGHQYFPSTIPPTSFILQKICSKQQPLRGLGFLSSPLPH